MHKHHNQSWLTKNLQAYKNNLQVKQNKSMMVRILLFSIRFYIEYIYIGSFGAVWEFNSM
jgi:hypothetical protein